MSSIVQQKRCFSVVYGSGVLFTEHPYTVLKADFRVFPQCVIGQQN